MKQTLEMLCGFVAPKSPAAIMSSVRITREFAYATDGPSSMRVMWDGPDCDIAIMAQQLSAALAGIPEDQDIKLVPAEGFCTLVAGRRKLKLRTIPVDGMPEIEVKGEPHFKPAGPLADALKYSLVAAATRDVARPWFNAVLVEQSDEGTHVVGTDGFRGSVSKVDDDKGSSRALIPRALAARIVSLAKFGGEVGFTDDRVIFRRGESTFIGVLIASKPYPNWQRFLRPDESKMLHITGSQASILAAADAAKRFAIDTVVLSATKNMLTITGKSRAGDEIEQEVDIDYAGPNIEVGVNPSYLGDAISSMGGWPRIALPGQSTGLPLVFHFEDRTGIVQVRRM